MENKLRLIHHLSHLDQNSIASKVYEEQKKMKIGRYHEARSFLAILNIKESDMKERNKRQWAKLVRECLKEKNRTDLLHRAKEYSKIDYIQMKEEDFELKNYFKDKIQSFFPNNHDN